MKKLARFLLVWIIVSILGGVIGYFWLDNKIAPMYSSTTQIYVVPGLTSEASLRATDGGLKDDFGIVFKSDQVISEAKRACQTSEDIASYITIKTPMNSNIIQIICNNPDQTTAKRYADAVAKSAIKNSEIIPVESMSILSGGSSTGVSFKPDLYRYAIYLSIAVSSACFLLELIITLLICSFSRSRDEDDEAEYNRYYGNVTNFTQGVRESYPNREILKAKKEAAATLNHNNTKDDRVLDEDELIDESDIMSIDDLTDLEYEEDSISNIKSSSEVIGRIPK